MHFAREDAFTSAAFPEKKYCRLRGGRPEQDIERPGHSGVGRSQLNTWILKIDLLLQVIDPGFKSSLLLDASHDLAQLLRRKRLFQVIERALLHRGNRRSNRRIRCKDDNGQFGMLTLDLLQHFEPILVA